MPIKNNERIIYYQNKYRIQRLKGVMCYAHIHYHMEITFVVKGRLTIECENSVMTLESGMGTVIMPYQMHGYSADDDTEMVVIEFDRFMIDEIVNTNRFREVRFNISKPTMQYILNVIEEYKYSEVHLKSIIYPLLCEFYAEHEVEKNRLQCGDLYQKTLKYIDDYFDDNINLKSAAEKIGCSYVYLSRIFAKTTGMTFTTYLNRYRILKSLAYLVNSDMNITEIAFKTGFETLRSYNREFKKIFNITPGEYRRNN